MTVIQSLKIPESRQAVNKQNCWIAEYVKHLAGLAGDMRRGVWEDPPGMFQKEGEGEGAK